MTYQRALCRAGFDRTTRRTYGFYVGVQDWMDPARWAERAASFGSAAQLYDQVRPPYPHEAVEWALAPLGPGHWRIADIGAGTGIMTRLLAAMGHDVVAVEPDDLMRRRLAETTPDVAAVAGRAESLPVPDGELDAAIAAQAYHWFDRRRAHSELARAIRPGGVFAAIWNDRDESVAWVARYSAIVEGDRGPDGSGADSGRAQSLSFGDGFEPTVKAEFHHSVRHTPETLVTLLKSRSYFLTASPARQAALESQVRDLAGQHADLAGRDSFPLPYVTHVYRAARIVTAGPSERNR